MDVPEDQPMKTSDKDNNDTEGGSDEESQSTSTSSSSDNESFSDDEGETHSLLQNLEASLAQNPYNFQDHVEYIRLLRKAAMLDRLREARERMSSTFPLSSEMWQEWISDEACLISSQEDVMAVRQLFERGLEDYLSVPLWLDYMEFNLKHDQDITQCNEIGVTRMRNLYERALAAASLHLVEGTKIWSAYLQYEMSLLSNKEESSEEVKAKQINCIRSIYRRQLSVPSLDVTSTLKNYIIWESQQGVQIVNDLDNLTGLPPNIASAYKKAVQMSGIRQVLEEKVSKENPKDADLLQNFLSYIALEKETGDPSRVQVLYERVIAEFPVTHDLWLKYSDYLENNLKGSRSLVSVYARATKNCPWNQALWSRYLLALERSNASERDISMVFEKSLNSGFAFSSPEEYLDHFLTRVDGLRRSMCAGKGEKPSYLATMRETFNQAVDILSTFFPTFVDKSLRLNAYWARLEHSLANDMAAARGVWENLIKSSGWMLEAWKGYISMEVHMGNLVEARALYRRCYTRKFEGNGTEVLCNSWLQFEREYGSLEDYDRAYMKVMPRLVEIKKLQQQQDAKQVAASSYGFSGADKKVAKNANISSSSQRKRPLQDRNSIKENKPKKKSKVAVSDMKVDKEDIKAHAKEGEIKMADVEKGPDTSNLDKKEKQWFEDQCTVFVARLAPEVNEEDLRELFSPCNFLKDVRLMKDRKTGASRGFAYVDFENEDGLASALKLHNQKVKGSKIRVLRSDPSLSRNKGFQSFGDGKKSEQELDNEAREKQHSNVGKERRGGRSITTAVSHRRGGHVQLTGKNTFAVPRSVVRPLGFSKGERKEDLNTLEPKSNEEFRKMLSKE